MKVSTLADAATVAVASAMLLMSVGAHAAEDGPYISPTNERVRITLGAEQIKSATNVRIDSTAGVPGTLFNAESDFGLDHNNTEPKFQASLRVSERHRLRFDYFTLDRTGSKVLDKPISFRDANYLVGDPVESQVSLRTLGITYGYSFIHREKFELAGTIGINVVDISARAKVQQPTRRIDQQEDAAGPFPTVGLDATWVISKRFYLDGRFQYLKVSLSDLNGSLGIYEFAALYRWRANVSFGAGYTGVRAKFNSTKTNDSGYFDFNAKGPEMFVRIAF